MGVAGPGIGRCIVGDGRAVDGGGGGGDGERERRWLSG